MTYLLPAPRPKFPQNLVPLLKKIKLKRPKFVLAALLDFILIVFILVNAKQPAQSLISPFVSSLHSLYSQTVYKITQDTFAFAPGLARNKFSDIDLEGLKYLSFFDVPLTDEGEINKSSRGFASFTSSEAAELFERARYKKTKILLTLSSYDEQNIANLLGSKDAQTKLADEAIEQIQENNIDGITIDFEFPKGGGGGYQRKFTDFVGVLSSKIHSSLPNAQVTVAVPSSLSNKSLYNTEGLSKAADKVFLVASDFIVPEVKNNKVINPVYGFSENTYFQTISKLLSDIFNKVSPDKLVMERAWYGNGDNYPLYVPNSTPLTEQEKEATHVALDAATLNNLVAGVPAKGREAARKNIPLIAKALNDEGILDSNVLAYALATVEHETDETFEPLEEIQGRLSARRLGYEGGMNYFGRGFIQLTHLRNYRNVGQRIGLGEKLAQNPDLAATPEVAAKILAAFFKDNNVANLASRGSFVAARRPVNPDYNGYSVARLAWKYVE